MSITSVEISGYRKRLRQLIDKIEKKAFHSTYLDPLLQGVASEVYRRCGKKNCKCVNEDNRHGPYLIIQIYENKKQRQISISEEKKHLWQQAKNYQSHLHDFLELKKMCAELINDVDGILQKRTIQWSEACKMKK